MVQQVKSPSFVVFIPADNGKEIVDHHIEPSFSAIQEFVGGYIQTFNIEYNGRKGIMGVNEEGALRQLQTNQRATKIVQDFATKYGRGPSQILAGNVVIWVGFRP